MKWREIKNEYEAQIERLRAQGPYELLEVSPNDTLQDIKRAYRRKVRRFIQIRQMTLCAYTVKKL